MIKMLFIRTSNMFSFVNILKIFFQTYYEGLSGEIKLDQEPGAEFRSDVKLDLIEKSRDRMEKTGLWTYMGGVNYTKSEEARQEQTAQKLKNKTLKVVTVPVIYWKYILGYVFY